MRISSTGAIEGGRVLYTIGRIEAASTWHPRARRLDHKHGEIAAAAMAELERLHRLLDSLRFSPPIEEAVIDAL